jgi:cytochrome c551/c552/multidrug efflux pump subunit AcrA (membrane-fusion protein)
MTIRTMAVWAALAGLAISVQAAETDLPDDRVAAVLERHCVHCHQGDEPKGGLSLSTAAAARKGGDSGAAFIAGQPEESLILQYVTGDAPAMPKDAPPLSGEDVETLRQWIAAGAPWPDDLTLTDKRFEGQVWWSLQPVMRPVVPVVESTWPRTPIDNFILARLRAEGLEPAPEADRRTLIRRLTFDLHGLPPTPEEIDAFLADTADGAYERLVDRLLDSPRYGERWGRHWLDTVHFGETHGYDKDKVRPHAWPYRDYVIAALNDDKPYSRFVQEQLAGDVLFPDDPAATVATGFIAAGPWDFVGHVELREGTVDKRIARTNDRDDMLMTAMSTFASMTAHCARCHDHKFDPIPQRDYYRLQAVFAGVDRADREFDADPAVARRRRELAARKASLVERQTALDARIAAVTSAEIAAVDAHLNDLAAALAAVPADPAGSPSLGYHSAIMPSQDETKWVQVDLGRSMPIEAVILYPAHVVYGGHPGPGFGFPPRFKIEAADTPDFAEPRLIVDQTAADLPNPGDASYRADTIASDGAAVEGRYVRVTATKLWERTSDWIFAVGEMVVLSSGENVAAGAAVTSLDSIEAPPGWAMGNLVDGFNSREAVTGPAGSAAARRETLNRQAAEAHAVRRKLVMAALDDAECRELADVTKGLADIEAEIASLPPKQLVYAAANGFTAQHNFSAPAEPRPVHLLHRGDEKQPGEEMSPGALSCVEGLEHYFDLSDPRDEGSRRAALAHWITDPANPLTRRSIVNRAWHYHFGRGIVDTPNDFGRLGSQPTHPELLDWLAAEFLAQGESLKWLHRLIVTSAVYRQASISNAAFDRIDAECVRDATLAVSGKLDLTMGGPSVQQFYFKDDHSPVYDYTRFDVDSPGSFRRGVYRFIVRSVPDPFMDCMDCADPSILTPKRNTTLTALQALALLNNPFMVRQAEHFAGRVSGPADDLPGQIDAAYRLALGRPPREDEAALLVAYARQHGLANACRVILNSNEFMFVD